MLSNVGVVSKGYEVFNANINKCFTLGNILSADIKK